MHLAGGGLLVDLEEDQLLHLAGLAEDLREGSFVRGARDPGKEDLHTRTRNFLSMYSGLAGRGFVVSEYDRLLFPVDNTEESIHRRVCVGHGFQIACGLTGCQAHHPQGTKASTPEPEP